MQKFTWFGWNSVLKDFRDRWLQILTQNSEIENDGWNMAEKKFETVDQDTCVKHSKNFIFSIIIHETSSVSRQ